MTQIEKIKAEIERRIKENEKLPHRYIRLDEDKQLLSFIESMEKGPIIDEGKDEIDEGFTRMMLKESAPKIKGWVARWKDSIKIFLFNEKPFRLGIEWHNETDRKILLPKDSFPELKWEDEPIEVELTISWVGKNE